MRNDWYRRKSWTAKNREEFFARLQRSRSAFHQAQYARIQACELLTTRTPEAYSAALELLDMIVTRWRKEAQLPQFITIAPNVLPVWVICLGL